MTRKAALSTLTIASPLILVTFVWENELTLWLFSFLTMLFPTALVVLGVSGRTGRRALGPYLLALLIVLEGAGAGMLLTSRRAGELAPWLFGLPPVTVFMLGCLWLAPLVIVSWAYPRTFSAAVLTRDELERVRRLGNSSARSLFVRSCLRQGRTLPSLPARGGGAFSRPR